MELWIEPIVAGATDSGPGTEESGSIWVTLSGATVVGATVVGATEPGAAAAWTGMPEPSTGLTACSFISATAAAAAPFSPESSIILFFADYVLFWLFIVIKWRDILKALRG